jgi:hypothetical protein
MKDLLEAATGPNKQFDPEKATQDHPELFNDVKVLREAIEALRSAELKASTYSVGMQYAQARKSLEELLTRIS